MFHASFPLNNRHIQTLYAPLFRRQKSRLKFEIERFNLDDGDFVECYWHNQKPTDRRPIVTLFHGLAGSYKSPYILGMMLALEREGFASVLMHFRGCSGKPNLLPRSYHSGDTADAKAWVDYLNVKYKENPLYAVGYSIGGNLLLKYLAQAKKKSPLKCAVSVSAPLDLALCAEVISKGFAKHYERYLLKPLLLSLKEKFKQHNMQQWIELKENEIEQIKSIKAFDDAYTAPMHGFKSAKEYYQKCSAKYSLKDIVTPTLIIHALDDPFMDERVIPKKEELSSFIELELSQHGGHVGFVTGSLFRPKYWLEERVPSYLKRYTLTE